MCLMNAIISAAIYLAIGMIISIIFMSYSNKHPEIIEECGVDQATWYKVMVIFIIAWLPALIIGLMLYKDQKRKEMGHD